MTHEFSDRERDNSILDKRSNYYRKFVEGEIADMLIAELPAEDVLSGSVKDTLQGNIFYCHMTVDEKTAAGMGKPWLAREINFLANPLLNPRHGHC